MDSLKGSFEDVADWCERHLEDERGREIGMTFGAVLRAYGRLATHRAPPGDDQRDPGERELNARAEALLKELSTRFLALGRSPEVRSKLAEPTSMRTNMTYDTARHSDDTRRPHAAVEPASNRPRFEIVQEDMGGWVRVFLGAGEPTGEVAGFLSQCLADWMRKRPHLRVRCAVPVTRDGDTVELHAWYEQAAFPCYGSVGNGRTW